MSRREWKWVSVQGHADPLWGSFLLSQPSSGPSSPAQQDWVNGLAPSHSGARDPGTILPSSPLLGKARVWSHRHQGDLPERFQHAHMNRNEGTARQAPRSHLGSCYCWQFLSKHSQEGHTSETAVKTLPLIKHPLCVRNLTFLVKNSCSEGGTRVIFNFPIIDGEREVQSSATCPESHHRSTRILLPAPQVLPLSYTGGHQVPIPEQWVPGTKKLI